MASLWEKIKAYLSGWPLGKDDPEQELKEKEQPKKKKKSKGKKQGNLT